MSEQEVPLYDPGAGSGGPWVIAASPHALYVAYFDLEGIEPGMHDGDLEWVVRDSPVIGWMLTPGKFVPLVPAPIAIEGVIERGVFRYFGESRPEARAEALAAAKQQRDRAS
jgi:hypothetical protein